jgi:sulfatase maturation enzyme AslB (radical SAM superfamily)
MDFRFSNICNMKCRTCSPTFSSSWYDDYIKKFGSVHPDIAEQKFIQLKNKPGFLEELWPLLDTVEEIYWAGGEPLVTDVHWDIMNHWIDTGRSEHITINYTTNFSQLTYKRQNVLDLWKKFKKVSVAASLDAMGTRGEYIRSGTEWSTIEANRREMIEKSPDIYFEITPTVSMMNVWHLPDFHEDWVNKGLLKPGAVRINNLLDPKYFCMQVLPDSFKKEVTDKWLAHIEKISSRDDYDVGINWVTEAQGMLAFLNKQDRTDELKNTFREWDTWDEVRNEKWYDALPELKFLEEYRAK